jgi:hypothetical protein
MVSAALDVVAAVVEITNLLFPHAKLISCWNRVTNIHIYGTMSIWIETTSTPLGPRPCHYNYQWNPVLTILCDQENLNNIY